MDHTGLIACKDWRSWCFDLGNMVWMKKCVLDLTNFNFNLSRKESDVHKQASMLDNSVLSNYMIYVKYIVITFFGL